MNREDIEAVEFLASEFSKESQSLKVAEQKDLADFETVDSTMLEVAAVQGVSDQTSLTTQCGEFSDAETTHEVLPIIFVSCNTVFLFLSIHHWMQ